MADEIKNSCPKHDMLAYRVDHLEKDVKENEICIADLKKQLNTIGTNQKLMMQQLKNLLWPILIMLGAVLVEVGKTFMGFIKG